MILILVTIRNNKNHTLLLAKFLQIMKVINFIYIV